MLKNIWDNFLKIMREEAGGRVVDTWFNAASLQEWDSINNVVYIQVPNAFVKDWMASNYMRIISFHLGRLLSVDQLKVILLDGCKKSFENDSKNNFCGASIVEVVNSGKDGAKNGEKELASDKDIKLFPAKVDYTKTAIEKSYNKKICHINVSFHFDNFVVGPNNSLAKAAAQAVTDKPGTLYNPLFIYGDSGLGKTHLLHAIGNELKNKNKNLAVLYQTADRFVTEFINAIRFDKVDRFQLKYQNVDVLLIDDIQFISNKEQTQEAFFHIFNMLYDSHKQIVFSSDTFPSNITGLADRLKSRLACGLVTDIHLPSIETKVAILQKKAKNNNQELSEDLAYFIASTVDSNIRELEGALIRVSAFSSLTGQPISIELAKKVLNRVQEVRKKVVDVEDVLKAVQKYYDFNIVDIKSKKRVKELSSARQAAMFLMKKHTTKSLRDIGMLLGGRDHSTVLHAIEKVEEKITSDHEFSRVLDSIERTILNRA